MTKHTTDTTTTICAFLTLPGELRNTIYDYMLDTASYSAQNRIELGDASPPSSALALACRQTFHEYIKLYREARISYFAINTFTLDLNAIDWNAYHCGTIPPAIARIHSRDLRCITSLVLLGNRHVLRLSKQGQNDWRHSLKRALSNTRSQWFSLNSHEMESLMDRFALMMWMRKLPRDCGLTKKEILALLRYWQ